MTYNRIKKEQTGRKSKEERRKDLCLFLEEKQKEKRSNSRWSLTYMEYPARVRFPRQEGFCVPGIFRRLLLRENRGPIKKKGQKRT